MLIRKELSFNLYFWLFISLKTFYFMTTFEQILIIKWFRHVYFGIIHLQIKLLDRQANWIIFNYIFFNQNLRRILIDSTENIKGIFDVFSVNGMFEIMNILVRTSFGNDIFLTGNWTSKIMCRFNVHTLQETVLKTLKLC